MAVDANYFLLKTGLRVEEHLQKVLLKSKSGQTSASVPNVVKCQRQKLSMPQTQLQNCSDRQGMRIMHPGPVENNDTGPHPPVGQRIRF